MAYSVRLDPRTGRYHISDPNRGEVPLMFMTQLLANDFCRLLNMVSDANFSFDQPPKENDDADT